MVYGLFDKAVFSPPLCRAIGHAGQQQANEAEGQYGQGVVERGTDDPHGAYLQTGRDVHTTLSPVSADVDLSPFRT